MDKNENKLKMAQISSSELEEIKALEKKLGDICLIAVERSDAIYVLEAKLGPNDWEAVDKVYPEIEKLRAFYGDEETAKLSKGALKSFLNASKDFKDKKKPVRIRRIN